MADKKEKSGFFGSIKNFFTGRAKYFKEDEKDCMAQQKPNYQQHPYSNCRNLDSSGISLWT